MIARPDPRPQLWTPWTQFIAIAGTDVLGAFDTELDAYLAMKKEHEVGTFLIQHCIPGTMSYTQTFHSRVVFQ